MASEFMARSVRKSLVLITGSPRSSTTAMHNALLGSGVFRGVWGRDLLDRDPVRDRALYTDEYYPSMSLAIDGAFASGKGRTTIHDLLDVEVCKLRAAFQNETGGLMLKAPHYVFGLDTYFDLYGEHLRPIFVHRSPFAIARSMTNHPHIGRQLPRPISECADFLDRHDLITRFGLADTVGIARQNWEGMPVAERGLFVWHLYANAFLRSVAGRRFMVVRNETFDLTTAECVAEFICGDTSPGRSIFSAFRPMQVPEAGVESLTEAGKDLWQSMAWLNNAICDMAMRTDIRPAATEMPRA